MFGGPLERGGNGAVLLHSATLSLDTCIPRTPRLVSLGPLPRTLPGGITLSWGLNENFFRQCDRTLQPPNVFHVGNAPGLPPCLLVRRFDQHEHAHSCIIGAPHLATNTSSATSANLSQISTNVGDGLCGSGAPRSTRSPSLNLRSDEDPNLGTDDSEQQPEPVGVPPFSRSAESRPRESVLGGG